LPKGIEVTERTFLMTLYVGGLRLSEAADLQIPHIDSGRMQLNVAAGKGKFCEVAICMTMRWLRRRSQKTSVSWQEFLRHLKHHPIVSPRKLKNLIASR